MVDEQNYALASGEVGPSPSWQAPKNSRQEDVLKRAFRGFSNQEFDMLENSGKIRSVVLKRMSETDIEIKYAARSVSGGGRASTRPDELRAQIEPATINELHQINEQGGIALFIGVYCIDGSDALVLWRPLDSSNGSSSSSKQIDAHVIARAMTNGVSSYVYPDGEIVYAIMPELLRSYIDCLMPKKKEGSYGTLPRHALKSQPHNLIFFGAPGTGKSFQLNKEALGEGDTPARFNAANVRRITFHPDYTYAQFVGCYKPYTGETADGKTKTGYKFVPGPFLDVYALATLHPDQDYLLIIEELNRANPAAVFGDVFQLLDRKDDGSSRYVIAVPTEMQDCLRGYTFLLNNDERTAIGEEFLKQYEQTLSLPPNMFIWATMNSADQGVFPMDTAFKRRWDFRYIGIDEKESSIQDEWVTLGNDNHRVKWNDFRKGINRVLLDSKVNEDKLLGPFFLNPAVVRDADSFSSAFKNKVLLYLYEDAAKTKKEKVFSSGSVTYATICLDFDSKGEGVFKDFPTLSITLDEDEKPSDQRDPEA